MIKTILLCDRCGREAVAESIYAVVGDQVNSADARTEDRCEPVDLCPLCCRAALADLVARMCHVDAQAWVDAMRKKLGQ